MKLCDQLKVAKRLLETEIKITKSIYKAVDSYQRRERWIGRELVKELRKQYGMAETDEVSERKKK